MAIMMVLVIIAIILVLIIAKIVIIMVISLSGQQRASIRYGARLRD